MKSFFSILFLVVIFSTSNSQIVRLHGQLKVKGTALVDVKGNDVFCTE
jgi:hypothetical protein